MSDQHGRKYNCIELSVGNTDFVILFGEDFHFRARSWVSPPHYHLFCECHFLRGGSYRMKTETQSELLSGDAFLVLPSRLRHSIDVILTPAQKISFYVVISENQVSELDTFPVYRQIFLSDKPYLWQKPNMVFNQVISLVQEVRSSDPLYETKLKHHFSLALIELYEQTTEKEPETAAQEGPLRYREEVLLKIEDFMVESFSPDATLEDLADHLCLSPRQTNRLLKQVFSSTFQEIKNQKRLESAKQMIRETELSLTEISEKLGYGSYTGFHKMFRLQTGMSPEEYRNTKE